MRTQARRALRVVLVEFVQLQGGRFELAFAGTFPLVEFHFLGCFKALTLSNEGLSIVCTTCQSQLRVRNEKLFGKILPCPKCGGMVLVAAPGSVDALDDFGDSEAALDRTDEAAPAATETVPSGIQPSDLSAANASSLPSWFGMAVGGAACVVIAGGMLAYGWAHWASGAKAIPVAILPVSTADLPVIETETDDDQDVNADSDSAIESDAANRDSESSNIASSEVATERTGSQAAATEDHEQAAPLELHTPATIISTHASQPPTQVSAASLSNLANLLSGESPVTTPTATPNTAPPLSYQDVVPGTLASKASGNASPAVVNATNPTTVKLDQELRAVRFNQLPLIEFVRAMVRLSGQSIYLDPVALQQTANRIDTPVSVSAIDVTVGDVLRTALQPINLVAIVEGDFVRISSPRLEDPKLISSSLFVGDLLGGRGNDLDLAAVISTLIAPQSWAVQGGQGTITRKADRLLLNNTDHVRIQAALLLEKLRVARGMRPRRKLPASYTNLEPRWDRLQRYYQRQVNMDVWQAEPLLNVVEQLEAAAGIRILIDWRALSETPRNWTPQTPRTLSARAQPIGELFDSFVESAEAALVPLDDSTVQLTSQRVASQRTYLEFYRYDQLSEAGRQLVEDLMLTGHAALDPASDMAFVVATSGQHRDLLP